MSAASVTASLADWPALAALPVNGKMTPIFTLSAACAAPPMATASTAATMVPALIVLSLIPSFVALKPDSISRLLRTVSDKFVGEI